MIHKKLPKHAKQRSVRRCTLVAAAEVTEPNSGARISGRTSELAMRGCYIDALNPLPEGTIVYLRILRDQGTFEAKAKVVYCHPGFGMGLAFTEVSAIKKSILEDWLVEIVSQLKPVS